uniref:Peptidase S54 rhomboid domain-containing protein n=1 Tax=Calcidiscus leptoporus TaxID=127549 RepID=A0A7S0P2Z1_9EUKA|mmetsp:Transcript_51968/g.119547  ORF Transcript_51968/g.119547 Transcript_51968/m.119547 type:complete len:398 (+) Transcript_51968:96-1289(+)
MKRAGKGRRAALDAQLSAVRAKQRKEFEASQSRGGANEAEAEAVAPAPATAVPHAVAEREPNETACTAEERLAAVERQLAAVEAELAARRQTPPPQRHAPPPQRHASQPRRHASPTTPEQSFASTPSVNVRPFYGLPSWCTQRALVNFLIVSYITSLFTGTGSPVTFNAIAVLLTVFFSTVGCFGFKLGGMALLDNPEIRFAFDFRVLGNWFHHADVFHLGHNVLTMWWLRGLERSWGSLRYAQLLVFLLIAQHLILYFLHMHRDMLPRHPGRLPFDLKSYAMSVLAWSPRAIGFSGVLYGLAVIANGSGQRHSTVEMYYHTLNYLGLPLQFELVMLVRLLRHVQRMLVLPLVAQSLVLPLIDCIVHSLLDPRVAFWVHLAGAMSGSIVIMAVAANR